MARAKEFDQEAVLESAMNCFWEQGYEATSIQDLVDATGVQRQSLYDTFGSKHDLFLRSLLRYQAIELGQLNELQSRHSKRGLPLIATIFKSCAAQALCDSRGCFVANCAAELGSSDKAVAERVRSGQEGLRALFEQCLIQAQIAGELPKSSSSSALAHFLVNAYFGLRLMAKTRPTRAMIGDAVSVTLWALR